MPMITLGVTGLREAERRLGTSIKPALRAATLGIAEVLRGRLARYPGPVKHPIKWKSEKQRRFYFWLRRSKGLPIGYTRNSDALSQRLGPSWTTERHGDLGALVGTKVSYARWVQSKENQQPMHAATGWLTDQAVAEEVVRSGVAVRIVQAAIRKALGG